ncbi:DUF4359 domain-containing protein [Argonema antarcticum]|uniref:DUF4359 domain-containing protein n=1 Tax=Argonema antarcticum TaxID=2942763 RepID=UPI0020138EF5|nr:DUF4359 domain-containing protein [Argonema antarcticum]MCL1475198.1 DUF4359 domain-containing protein [Argonema antarcticum A004/B2]
MTTNDERKGDTTSFTLARLYALGLAVNRNPVKQSHIKTIVLFVINIIGIFLTIAAVSNPTKEEYLDEASDRFRGWIVAPANNVCTRGDLNLPILSPRDSQQICQGLVDLWSIGVGITANEKTKLAIDSVTRRKNYVFFSVYETDLQSLSQFDAIGITKQKTLGIFGNFFVIKQEQQQ